MATIDIDVEGLPQFVSALRLSPAKLKQAQLRFQTEAARTVRDYAQANARALGGVAAKSAQDISVAGSGSVRYGGKPYNIGAEFGSYQYTQFDRWRGKGDDAGYFLFPAVRKFRDESMTRAWNAATADAYKDAFNG